MSEWIELTAIVGRLASDALLSRTEAGTRLQEALARGDIQTRAAVSIRPRATADFHSETDVYVENFALPRELWKAVSRDWDDEHSYFRLWAEKSVYVASDVQARRDECLQFLRRLSQVSGTVEEILVLPEPVDTAPVHLPKSGRPTIHDWGAAAGAAAAYIVETGEDKKAPIVKYLADWFQSQRGKAPDESDIKKMVGALLSETSRIKAFRPKV